MNPSSRITRNTGAFLLAAALVGTIVAANAALARFGSPKIGPVAVPAGVWFAGATFILRDLLHQVATRPRWWVLGAIAAGTVTSVYVSAGGGWRIAAGSGLAFLASELLDYAVFTRLHGRGFLTASVASNIVGAIVDTLVFLPIAFGSLAYAPGQVAGKLAVTVLFVAAYRAFRR